MRMRHAVLCRLRCFIFAAPRLYITPMLLPSQMADDVAVIRLAAAMLIRILIAVSSSLMSSRRRLHALMRRLFFFSAFAAI